MSRFFYFAYGSNLLTRRLIAPDRCPSAKYHANACADHFSLEFSKISRDGSGKATLCPSHESRIHGVVFTIEHRELGNLDRAEFGYRREDRFEVRLAGTGDCMRVSTYIALDEYKDPGLEPYDWYLALCIAGALEHKLPEAVTDTFRNTAYWTDSNASRQTDALRILRAAGIDGIGQVLNLTH
ncbi:MAG: gamma-glutamylcyclotransferase [Gammaproteobacteria bacterium]|nr:gamma-glutamylcyclotransferase [Gammaproteobacteria bacterium]